MIATPRSSGELSQLVRECAARGERIAIRGGATHSRPWQSSGASCVIVTTGLDRVVDHQAENLVIEVEAGIRFAVLQRTLAEYRQRVPLDPSPASKEDDATLGGILSANRFGPRRLRFGTARDWVIGTWLVRADGAEVHSGGKVVKNVQGYDLSKLYLGARGAFGVLTRVALKLDTQPEAQRWIQARFASYQSMQDLMRQLEQAQVGLSGALCIDATLAILLEGWESLIARDTERALEQIEQGGGSAATLFDRVPQEAGDDATWKRSVRIAVRRSSWPMLASATRTLLDEAGRAQLSGDPCCGALWARWDDPAEIALGLTSLATAHGATAILETWPADEPSPALTSIDPHAQRLEKSLKAALDPDDRFVTEPW